MSRISMYWITMEILRTIVEFGCEMSRTRGRGSYLRVTDRQEAGVEKQVVKYVQWSLQWRNKVQ
jgi:hypothetical protein